MTNTNITKTKMASSLRRWDTSAPADPGPGCDVSYLGRVGDWYGRDDVTGLPVVPPRRRSLSPTRKLALEQLEAQRRAESRVARSIASSGGHDGGHGRDGVVYKARSVLDVDRLRRRADRRRDEVVLHLVSHDPSSTLFRAALDTPVLPSYQLAPRLPELVRVQQPPNRHRP